MTVRWHNVAAFVVLATTAACGSGTATTEKSGAPAPETSESAATLTVENLGFSDVTVYAVSPTGNRIRLGDVPGNSTQQLSLPRYLVRGGETLRFFADPIGGGQAPVSEEFYVAPGDRVTLTIPPR
jgi:hypothetical protein